MLEILMFMIGLIVGQLTTVFIIALCKANVNELDEYIITDEESEE